MLEPGQPLHDVQSLLVTPRLAAYTREARLRSAWAVARRLDEILRLTPTGMRNQRPGIAAALSAVDVNLNAAVETRAAALAPVRPAGLIKELAVDEPPGRAASPAPL
jgi:D-3-phosphoglycerate dehydrogenase